jgi:addiction module HigA family antidote
MVQLADIQKQTKELSEEDRKGLVAYLLHGIPASRLTEITKCRRRLTAETALRLAKFFGTSAAFWIGLQSEHDLEVAERAVGARIKREVVSLAS